MIIASSIPSTSVQTLVDQISQRGWQVTKVTYKKSEDGFIATGKGPMGDEVTRVGRDEGSALTMLLQHIIRKEYIRQPIARLSMWQSTWVDKLEEIAEEYAKAPIFDAKAATAWKVLADDSVARAAVLQNQVQVEITSDPEPYKKVSELVKDVTDKQHIWISRAGLEHPVWTAEQVVAFRLVHDVMGHVASGGDFTWQGVNLAVATHMPLLHEEAQKALFSEVIGKAAYVTAYQAYGPHKIALLKALDEAQDKENDDQHAGEHPKDTHAPGKIPSFRTAGVRRDPNHDFQSGIQPLSDAAYLWAGDPLDLMGSQGEARKLETGWHKLDGEGSEHRQKQAVTNAFRSTLLSPGKGHKWNAVHYQDLMHVPFNVNDPQVYHDHLEKARNDHNISLGMEPNAHKPHIAEEQAFIRWMRSQHPHLAPQQLVDLAKREIFHMQAEEEEKLLAKHSGSVTDLEPKVLASLAKRLKMITHGSIKPLLDHKASLPDDPPRILESNNETNGDYDMNRRPFVYHPEHNTVYLGQPGQFHSDLREDFPPEHEEPFYSAYVGGVHGTVYGPRDDPGYWSRHGIEFQDQTHYGQYPHVLHALSQHTGTPIKGPKRDVATDHMNLDNLFGEPDDDFFRSSSLEPPEPPQIIESPGNINGGYDPDRRPFFYHPETKKVYLGQLGQFHHDIYADLDEPQAKWFNSGPVAQAYNQGVHGEVTSQGMRFFAPRDNARYLDVLDHLSDHTGQPLNPKVHGEVPSNPGTINLDDLFRHGATTAEPYGGYTVTSLKHLAHVGKHADVLTRAALEDVRSHGGRGHHFRQTTLGLDMPGVSPQTASQAWYLLNPMHSELAPVDAHHMEMLGRDHAKEMSPRDFFKFERELTAARDASGYAHMPLGQFSGSLRDSKRLGEGLHQDYSAFRTEAPQAHHTVDWDAAKLNHIPNGMWTPPLWWYNTELARQQVGEAFDRDVSPKHPRQQIPYAEERVPTSSPIVVHAAESNDEFHFALGLQEETIKRINEWVALHDFGKPQEPRDYHITLAYAPQGWKDLRAHNMIKNFSLTGMPFRVKGLDQFNDSIVLLLESDSFADAVTPVINRLKTLGLEVSEFPGGPKAHITIAEGKLPEDIEALALNFRSGDAYVSRPRGLAKTMPVLALYDPITMMDRMKVPLPGMPCLLHAWKDCPMCVGQDEGTAEHNPLWEPNDDFDQQSRMWYNTRKEPGLTNPSDPFADLKPASGAV